MKKPGKPWRWFNDKEAARNLTWASGQGNDTGSKVCGSYFAKDGTFFGNACDAEEMFGVCMAGECMEEDEETDETDVTTTAATIAATTDTGITDVTTTYAPDTTTTYAPEVTTTYAPDDNETDYSNET